MVKLFLEQFSSLTGSRAYGGYRESSDYDYIILHKHYQLIKKILEAQEINYNYTNETYDSPSIYFLWKGFEINIIPLEEGMLEHWAYATEQMKLIEPVSDRDERVAKFQFFTIKSKEKQNET